MISLEVNSLVTHSEAVHATSKGVQGPASGQSGHAHWAPAPEDDGSLSIKNLEWTVCLFGDMDTLVKTHVDSCRIPRDRNFMYQVVSNTLI